MSRPLELFSALKSSKKFMIKSTVSRKCQISSFSIDCCIVPICCLICEPSFDTTEHATTGRETPHARPSANTNNTCISDVNKARAVEAKAKCPRPKTNPESECSRNKYDKETTTSTVPGLQSACVTKYHR